jgi:hypothetical protein
MRKSKNYWKGGKVGFEEKESRRRVEGEEKESSTRIVSN